MPYKTYLTKHCKAEWWNAGMAWIVRKILPPKKEKEHLSLKRRTRLAAHHAFKKKTANCLNS